MTAHAFFALPSSDHDRSMIDATAALLNTVPMTAELVEQAYQVFAHARPFQKLEVLLAFARSKGLASENIAAHALLVRAYQLADIRADGFDVETELPELYEAITVGPITAEDLGSTEALLEPVRDDEPELPLH